MTSTDKHSDSLRQKTTTIVCFTALILLSGLVFASESSAQCAMCRKSLEEGGSAGLIDGFYWSIILMISTPTMIVAGISTLIYRSWRRQNLGHIASSPVTEST